MTNETPTAKPISIIRGLTLWRPWPWAMCFAGKRAENRTWVPRSVEEDGVKHWLLRGFVDGVAEARQSVKLYLAIHAGQSLDRDVLRELHERHRARGGVLEMDNEPGRIVAVARLARVIDVIDTLPDDPARAPHNDWIAVPDPGDLPEGKRPYAWILEDLLAFRQPVPARGGQGLWVLRPELLAEVRKAFKLALAWERAEGDGS